MNSTFKRGRKKYGDRALSTSIVKMLEEACKEDLRSDGFPSYLEDKEAKKEGKEISI